MPRCWHCNAESPAAHWQRVVENKTALYGEWEGWRMAGRYLIAPGTAGKILPARLLGLLWHERAQVQKRTACPVASVVLPARELFRGQA